MEALTCKECGARIRGMADSVIIYKKLLCRDRAACELRMKAKDALAYDIANFRWEGKPN